MTTHRGYKYRIYPTKEQAAGIASILGCCRFVYNHFLAVRREKWTSCRENVTYTQTSALLTILKCDPERLWLAGADSMALQESLRDLDKAYRNFFEKRSGYPKFKRKYQSKQSYRTRNQSDGIRIEGNAIVLPRLGKVKAKISRLPKGRILNATVTRTATDKFFVSLCVEEDVVPKPNNGGRIGLDLGIKDFYVDSNGNIEPNHKFLSKYEKQLRREQRKLSRMMETNIAGYRTVGSKRFPIWKKSFDECRNIQKQRIKVAHIHEKIYNCRTDNLHKVVLKLVNENQVIAVESLNVKGMVRNHHLAKAISDASWSRFVSILEYKSLEYGCEVRKIPTFYPSSQTCASCGYKNPRIKDLSVRSWACPECGVVHDRDRNAAKNILKVALDIPAA